MNLNEEQKQIVNNITGASLIAAPVGTGKTTVLSERVLKAINKGIPAQKILCLTFTNRAAEEMSERIRENITEPKTFEQLTIKTFHGFCASFCKSEFKNLNLPSDFTIFDDQDQEEIMKRILQKYPLVLDPNNNKNSHKIYNIIDLGYKLRFNQFIKSIGIPTHSPMPEQELLKITEDYEKTLSEQNALDFNQLVLLTLKGLYCEKKILNTWSHKYEYIQLDEFQDTHLSEYLVIKQLARYYKNISFIGDLDQTIYSWRGSNPIFIANLFKKHFAPVKEYHLNTNYRFNPKLLKAINSFHSCFKTSHSQTITSHSTQITDTKPISLFAAFNFSEEIEFITNKIKSQNPKAKTVILSRSNPTISKISEIFKQKNIPHITVDRYNFFRRQEVRDIFAYLKILINPYDLQSIQRILARPPKTIGTNTLNKIKISGQNIGFGIPDLLNFNNYNFPEPFFNLIKKYQQGRIIVLDTETTGTNTAEDDIVQIYAKEIINGQTEKEFHHYLQTNKLLGKSALIHGLDKEFLDSNGEKPKIVLKNLKKFINNDIVCGHNISFDLGIIKNNCAREGININFKETYDTLDLSKRLFASPNYKLSTLAQKFNLACATHSADDDVQATIELLDLILNKLSQTSEERINLFTKISPKFIKLAQKINSWKQLSIKKRPAALLSHIWKDSGLKDYYQKDKEKDNREKSIKTLIKFFNLKDDNTIPPQTKLYELIQLSSLKKNIDFLGLEQGQIPIVTIHQVKGLEFDYVFIVGMNEFKFPIKKSDQEEEKRLFYVGLTRAKEKIYLSYSQYDDFGRPCSPSEFINYIDPQYVFKE